MQYGVYSMTDHESTKDKSKLVLGWQMDSKQEPKYWVGDEPKAGHQSPDDLVTVPADAIGSHTAIIAQSGSGKSFFLGRLIEEILVQTKARCIIFDPNADFRKIHEVENKSLWESPKYDRRKRRGKLPHESSREVFEKHWSLVRKATRIKMGGDSSISGENYETLQLLWSSLSVEFLAEEVDPMLRSDLYHCHTFAHDLEILFRLNAYATEESPDNLIVETEKLFRHARLPEGDFRSTLEEEFNVDEILNRLFKGQTTALFREGSKLVDVMEMFAFTVPRYNPQWSAGDLAQLYEAYKELRVRGSGSSGAHP